MQYSTTGMFSGLPAKNDSGLSSICLTLKPAAVSVVVFAALRPVVKGPVDSMRLVDTKGEMINVPIKQPND